MKGKPCFRSFGLRLLWAACCLLPSAYASGQPPAWGSPLAGRSAGPACDAQGTHYKPLFTIDQFLDHIGRESAKAVCRVRVDDRDGTISAGSGTLVAAFDDDSGLVVTNAHVIRDRRKNEEAGQIIFGNGDKSSFNVMHADEMWDFAVLEVDAPRDIPVAELADAPPKLGETLAILGFPGGKPQLMGGTGVYAKRLAPRVGQPFEIIELVPCAAMQGQSGGPVFNTSGKVAGALFGSNFTNYTTATPCHRIRAIVDAIRQRLGRAPRKLPRPSISPGPIATRPPASLPGPDTSNQPSNSPSNPPTSIPSPPATEGAGPSVTPSQPPERERPDTQPASGDAIDAIERIKKLEAKLSEFNRDHPDVATAATDAADAVAPTIIQSLASKFGAWGLTALGGLTGFGLPIGGVAAGGWLATKLIKGVGGIVRNRMAARKAAKQQGRIAGNDAGGGMDAPFSLSPGGSLGGSQPSSFDPKAIVASEVSRLAAALKSDLQSTIDAKLSVIGQQAKATAEIVAAKPDPAPNFVPTQVDNPNLIALEKALETFGGQTPANAKWVNLIYSFRDQLLNRAKAA